MIISNLDNKQPVIKQTDKKAHAPSVSPKTFISDIKKKLLQMDTHKVATDKGQ